MNLYKFCICPWSYGEISIILPIALLIRDSKHVGNGVLYFFCSIEISLIFLTPQQWDEPHFTVLLK